ncbi:MAG TPA: SseB family protein [Methylomirabilota bacterium]|nr:SseB family protein [Methylomirabilota bacterium]
MEPLARANLHGVSDDVEAFTRALSRVHSGASGAVVELAGLLQRVRLVVAVTGRPVPGESIAIPVIKTDDGKTLLPCFSSESSFLRWSARGEFRESGTLPAIAIFEEVLRGPFEGLVFDLAGPNRMIVERDVLLTAVNLARSGDRPQA